VIDVLCSIATVMLFVAGIVTRPTTVACPRGWFPQGVRSSGAFACQRPPTGWPGGEDAERSPSGVILMRVYCTNGQVPVLHDRTGSTVGCMRAP
jgi:hypothetical protein